LHSGFSRELRATQPRQCLCQTPSSSASLSLTSPKSKVSSPLHPSGQSHSVCTDLLPRVSQDVDAVELRVDLLASREPLFLAQQVALLRRHSRKPVIWTVRSKTQGEVRCHSSYLGD